MTQTKVKSKMIDWPTTDAGRAALRGQLGFGSAGPLTGFRNKIINGNFDYWQRGTSQTGLGYGCADRWLNMHDFSSKTASRQAFTLGQTDVPGEPAFFLRHVVTSSANAAAYVNTAQRIESVRTFAGQKARLSFEAKADAAKPIAVELWQVFGTGGSPSANVNITPQKVTLSSSWDLYEMTFDIPSIAGKTLGTDGNDCLELIFWFDAGSNFNARTDTLGQQSGTFDIAQVQFEPGEVTTPFEDRPRAIEVMLCSRYYQVAQQSEYHTCPAAGAGYASHHRVPFTTMMRSTPTIGFSYSSSYAIASYAFTGGPDGFTHYIASSAAANAYAYFTWTASAEL